MKILLLATNYKSLAVKKMVKAMSELEIEFNILNPTQLFLMISNQKNGRNQLFDDYLGKTIRMVDLKSYDVVIPRIGKEVAYSCEVLKYLEEVFKMKSIQSSEAIANAFSKIRTSILLRANGVRTPRTVYVNKINNVDIVLNRLSKDCRYVIKLDKGSKGKQVSIVSGMAETKSVLDTIGSMSQQLIIQEYIESNGTDIRAIVVGDRVIASYQRNAGDQELRTNISTGGGGTSIELSEEDKLFCVESAKAVGLEFAGVDLIKSVGGKSYCIEVNHCPGMNVQKFTSVDIGKEIVRLAIEKAKESSLENISLAEVKELRKVYNQTFNNIKFKKLFFLLKGKVVESKLSGTQTVIRSKIDLQKLLLEHLVIR